jgi:hypothetical protein
MKRDHLAELGPVAVPSDRGARRIFGDQRMLERGRVYFGEGGGGVPKRTEEAGKGLRGFETGGGEVVPSAEGDDAPQSFETVKIERPKGRARKRSTSASATGGGIRSSVWRRPAGMAGVTGRPKRSLNRAYPQ